MSNPHDIEVPEYRVVDPKGAFLEPSLIPAGSRIRYNGPPGPHLMPLNKAAMDRMESWYEEEYDEVDKAGKKTGEKVKPHAKYRMAPSSSTPSEQYSVQVLEEARPQENIQSLAEILAAKASTNVRPPPSVHIPTADIAAPAQLKSGAQVIETPRPALKPRPAE